MPDKTLSLRAVPVCGEKIAAANEGSELVCLSESCSQHILFPVTGLGIYQPHVIAVGLLHPSLRKSALPGMDICQNT